MANDIGGNPWKIDTASATAIYNDKVWIQKLVWHEPTTAGHVLSVTDKDGKVIWDKTALAGGAGLDYELEVEGAFDGLIVPTMSSGTLYVYIK